MKVLFVSSKNKFSDISPIIKNQGDSLVANGCHVNYFGIEGKGFWGYLKNIKKLRTEIVMGNYDLIHAHYSYSGFLASLVSHKPVVVSLMGSDVNQAGLFLKSVIAIFHRVFWSMTIVKTDRMAASLKFDQAPVVLPNGVNLSKFVPLDKQVSRETLGIDPNCILILFASDPNRREKNFVLTADAFKLFQAQLPDAVLFPLIGIPHEKLVNYYNAADVLLLTSLQEGSPNVIKEAMACCLPVVATNVGDVKYVIEGVSGCFLSEFTSVAVYENMVKAIQFRKSEQFTDGRTRLKRIGYDHITVAHRLISLYLQLLEKKSNKD